MKPQELKAILARSGIKVGDETLATARIGGKAIADIPMPTKKRSKYRSKAESLYADKLEWDKHEGLVQWWAYEAVTLVIADASGTRCRYTPDFAVSIGGGISFVEIKGFMREAARLRFLAARERYPFWNFRMIRREKNGEWKEIL